MIVNTGIENEMYTVEVNNISIDIFSYALGIARFDKISQWCNDHFNNRWNSSENCNKFYFSSEEDRTLFLLRWA